MYWKTETKLAGNAETIIEHLQAEDEFCEGHANGRACWTSVMISEAFRSLLKYPYILHILKNEYHGDLK